MQTGKTSLAHAAMRGHKEAVAVLLKAGANIEAADQVSDVMCGMHMRHAVDEGVW